MHNIAYGYACRANLERRVDEGCAIAFSGPPYTLLAAAFDLQWLGRPAWRKDAYEASRNLFRFEITVEDVQVELISTTEVDAFRELFDLLHRGALSQSAPLCERLNGYGVRIQYDPGA